LPPRHIRHNRNACRERGPGEASGTRFVTSSSQELFMVSGILNPIYWDKKIKIAILALATFMAMC
jgi:hypothetical protein